MRIHGQEVAQLWIPFTQSRLSCKTYGHYSGTVILPQLMLIRPTTLFAAALLYSSGILHSTSTLPNIVVVMADDIGLGDISFYQNERTNGQNITVNTPNLDRLIETGMRFSDAHSPASLCAPTRFAMLTGNFSYRNGDKLFGVWTPFSDSGIDPKWTTSARIAKAGGYKTAFFGKWGLGSSWLQRKVDWAEQNGGALHFGFDYSLELPEGIQGEPFAFYENNKWMKLGEDSVLTEVGPEQNGYIDAKKMQDYSATGDSNWDPKEVGPILAHKAVDYIQKQTDDTPFYLYYCSQAVHIPHTPINELDGVKIAGSTPGVHGDMILELDTQIGMLVDALKQEGLYENTLFIFTSDNGGLSFDPDMRKAGHQTSNGLREKKGSIYEGGHRVPFIAVWPGKIKPGSICNEPIVAHDVVATIADIANQPIDRGLVLDSASLLPRFAEEPATGHRYLMHLSSGQRGSGGSTYAIRDGDWKLIMRSKVFRELDGLHPTGLYNLKDDLAESNNLIEVRAHENRVQAMFEDYKLLRETGVSTIIQ